MIGIVVLNYLNYTDTIECVDSLLQQSFKNIKIIIVDNNSYNDSFDLLKKKYGKIKHIKLIKSNKNIGFSKGNNIGIKQLKSEGIDNVLVLNNDTYIKDEYFLEKLSKINFLDNVGAIGPSIIGSDGKKQNPVYINANLKHSLKVITAILLSKIGIDYKKMKKNKEVNQDGNGSNFILHGSAIFLTKNYLKFYDGFYSETFLYFEEEILSIIMKKENLNMLYCEDLVVYHKEDQSSLMSFNNINEIKQHYVLKSVLKSLKVIITPKLFLRSQDERKGK